MPQFTVSATDSSGRRITERVEARRYFKLAEPRLRCSPFREPRERCYQALGLHAD